MQQVHELFCIDPGRPDVSGKRWRTAVLSQVERSDPFTGKRALVPRWIPSDDACAGHVARVHYHVDLDTDPAWASARHALAAQSSALHEGILFELWNLVLGEVDARMAWKPAWMAEDSQHQLMQIPDAVTRWLATSNADGKAQALERWIHLPYLTNAGGANAELIGGTLIEILSMPARIAVSREAIVVAQLSDYVAP